MIFFHFLRKTRIEKGYAKLLEMLSELASISEIVVRTIFFPVMFRTFFRNSSKSIVLISCENIL